MKILGGTLRGRVLHSGPKSAHLRPILARIKKSVFDIIRPYLPGSRFLDIYAGTGSVGLEALSEGAAHAVFLEKDRRSASLIRQNIVHLKVDKQADVFGLDVAGNLSSLPKPFDIVFLGPPYVDEAKAMLNLTGPTLEQIRKYELLAPQGFVIAQHHKKEIVTDSEAWLVKREERYGDSVVTFLKLRSAGPE